jgi:hypothetical protein
VKEPTDDPANWLELVRYAMAHFPAEWLLVAFSIFVLGWVLRGTAEPVMKYWKEDREAKRKHVLELAKFEHSKEKRGASTKSSGSKT